MTNEQRPDQAIDLRRQLADEVRASQDRRDTLLASIAQRVRDQRRAARTGYSPLRHPTSN